MKQYKIRVNNEAESKEAQELFFEMGGDFYFGGKLHCNTHLGLVTIDKDGLMANIELDGSDYKEITLPELRDLVVLKRNDKNDRNVIDPVYEGANLYLDSKNNLFVFHIPTQKWKESNLNHDQEVLARLQSIEKTMKEYLNPEDGYNLVNAVHALPHWIEVPEGAAAYVSIIGVYTGFICNMEPSTEHLHNALWVRPTLPEELPFIDDEPHGHYKKDASHLKIIDVYDILKLFNVTDPCLQHLIKKALCAGERGHKDRAEDLQDILDTAQRAVELNKW